MKKSQYQALIDKLQAIVNKFQARLETKQNNRFGRATRLLGLTLAIADLQMEMFAYGEDDIEEGKVMRKRTSEQILVSKAIYRKHAEQYKANDYPEHRARRMLAYTAHLNKVIAGRFKR